MAPNIKVLVCPKRNIRKKDTGKVKRSVMSAPPPIPGPRTPRNKLLPECPNSASPSPLGGGGHNPQIRRRNEGAEEGDNDLIK